MKGKEPIKRNIIQIVKDHKKNTWMAECDTKWIFFNKKSKFDIFDAAINSNYSQWPNMDQDHSSGVQIIHVNKHLNRRF